jgi:hypothetical protein
MWENCGETGRPDSYGSVWVTDNADAQQSTGNTRVMCDNFSPDWRSTRFKAMFGEDAEHAMDPCAKYDADHCGTELHCSFGFVNGNSAPCCGMA